MPLAFTYPLMKRFTYWPQLFLGITFNYGLILGWTSINSQIDALPIIFYIGAIFWTLGYDTIYGYQDIKDDEIIGVKSTSIKFKKNPKIFISGCFLIFILCLLYIGYKMTFSSIYFFGIIIIISLHLLIYQIKFLNINDQLNCLSKFKSNNLIGFLVFINIFWKNYFMTSNFQILKRLYFDYSKNYIGKIILSGIFSLIVAGSTSAIAYLLDPAIKKIFVEKDENLILIIPLFIILAFFAKGLSLYLARVLMISVGNDIKKDMQDDMLKSLIRADTNLIQDKHSGKYLNHVLGDTSHIVNLVSTTILNAFKDSLTLVGLLCVMFYQNWKLSLIAILMIPIATLAAKSLGKRIGKVTTEAQEKSGEASKYLMELFKNHKLIKIFQKEDFRDTKIK